VEYHRFCTRLEEVARKAVSDVEARARPVMITHGAGRFLAALKHNRPVANLRMQWERERHYRVVLVDEHRTSLFRYGTATQLRDIYRAVDGRYVRGVQWCDATNIFGCMPFTLRDAKCGDEHPLVPAQRRRPPAAHATWSLAA
jgi:hypothetical protein